MKSPGDKIQLPTIIKIEPLVAPEPVSVPPLHSLALAAESLAVPKSGQLLTPDVRDATSVAASLNAWDGDPVDEPCPFAPPLDIEMDAPRVFHIEEPLFPPFDLYRDTYPCFKDSNYARLPQNGRLRSLFYTTLFFSPHPPGCAGASSRTCQRVC